PEASPTPTPEESPTPTPEASPTPTPEESPTPTPEETPAPTPEPTPPPTFRAAEAAQIHVIPSKATRSHKRVIVTGKGSKKLTVLDENGESEDLDTDDDTDLEEGDDVLLIVQDKGPGQDKEARAAEKTEKLNARMQNLITQAEDAGKTDLAERIQERLESKLQKEEERLDRTLNNAPAKDKDKVEKAKGGPPDDKDKGGPPEDKDKGGPPEDKDKGGPPDDKDKGGGNDKK
ncbi:hypothetical protein ACFLTS_07230, partial [Chloroflexota bacterium]